MRTWRRDLLVPRLVGPANAALDRLVRPTATVARRQVSAFRLCGHVGLVVAAGTSQVVVAAHGASPLTMLLLTGAAVVAFLVLVALTTLVTGEEIIVYYHHQGAVLLVCTGLLWALDQPFLAYLDAVLLGLGGFLLCGRVGCLLVGCCHGRPARWGARYGPEHATHGFTPGYVGVRLLPVPALEALAVAGIVALGVAQVVGGAPPGQALVWYVVAYGAVRSWLELLRGDPRRPHLGGVSHGQWTSLALVTGMAVAVALAAGGGALPRAIGACATGLAVTAGAIVVAWARWRRSPPDAELLGPRHLAEVAEMLRDLSDRRPGLHVAGPSSAGLVISGGPIDPGTTSHDHHYGLSARPSPLSPGAARGLARAVLRLRHPDTPAGRLVDTHTGVHHLLIDP